MSNNPYLPVQLNDDDGDVEVDGEFGLDDDMEMGIEFASGTALDMGDSEPRATI